MVLSWSEVISKVDCMEHIEVRRLMKGFMQTRSLCISNSSQIHWFCIVSKLKIDSFASYSIFIVRNTFFNG